DAARKSRCVAQQFHGRRRGNRQQAMFCLYAPAANIHLRASKAIDSQQLESDRGADNVDNRIHGSDFVKMNFLDGDVMDFGFGLAKTQKYLPGALSGAWRERS